MSNSYIKNKRKMDKSISRYSLLFWIINFIFVQISINILLKIITANRQKWLAEAVYVEMERDPLFEARKEMIVGTVVVIMVAVMIFSMVTLILFRNIQLRNMMIQMGVLTTLGYDKKNIYKFCMQEPFFDMIAALPISIVISAILWFFIGRMEVVRKLMELMNDNIALDVLSYILCSLIMLATVMLHMGYFINKSLKKGIRYMLGKGIV